MNNFSDKIKNQVLKIGHSPSIDPDAKDLLRVLYSRFVEGKGKITQKELAAALPHLGGHARHDRRTEDTTLRQVRQVIRDLRVYFHAPIISSVNGYWLPRTETEAREYVDRVEKEVKARVAASFETYKAIRDSLGIASAYFDGQEKLL